MKRKSILISLAVISLVYVLARQVECQENPLRPNVEKIIPSPSPPEHPLPPPPPTPPGLVPTPQPGGPWEPPSRLVDVIPVAPKNMQHLVHPNRAG